MVKKNRRKVEAKKGRAGRKEGDVCLLFSARQREQFPFPLFDALNKSMGSALNLRPCEE